MSFDGTDVFGYLGSCYRSLRRDQFLEKILRERGLDSNGIVFWLSSNSARHLMNDEPRKLKEFKKATYFSTEDAFLKVLIWSHPEHKGNFKSTQDLHKKIQGIKV